MIIRSRWLLQDKGGERPDVKGWWGGGEAEGLRGGGKGSCGPPVGSCVAVTVYVVGVHENLTSMKESSDWSDLAIVVRVDREFRDRAGKDELL